MDDSTAKDIDDHRGVRRAAGPTGRPANSVRSDAWRRCRTDARIYAAHSDAAGFACSRAERAAWLGDQVPKRRSVHNVLPRKRQSPSVTESSLNTMCQKIQKPNSPGTVSPANSQKSSTPFPIEV